MNKITIITIVYNDAINIGPTIESCLSQSWKDKEYIIIDGGSSDGTAEIIGKYANQLAYWCSEPDRGIYDAMNKGIEQATGDWIIFLNSGDRFATNDSLKDAIVQGTHDDDVDVIYGNSIEVNDVWENRIEANSDASLLEYYPVYRHGSSLVKASVQKAFPFDLGKKEQLSYALDAEMIHRLYRAGKHFRKVDVYIEAYQREGTSNHPLRNLWYNYKITSDGLFSLRKFMLMLKLGLITLLKGNRIYSWLKAFGMEWMVNDVLPHIPFWSWRKCYLKMMGLTIGKESFIMKHNYFINPNRLVIGSYSHINRDCILDARASIKIGDSVSISHRVNLMTGSHDAQSTSFVGIFKPIIIHDYVWIGVGATILQGVTIGHGAVVAAGSVVTHDVAAGEIVAGIPAQKIGNRPTDLHYKCRGYFPLT